MISSVQDTCFSDRREIVLYEVCMASLKHDNSNNFVNVSVCVFSVQTHISQTSRCLACSTSEDCEPSASAPRDSDATNILPDVVQPATPQNTLQFEEQESADR